MKLHLTNIKFVLFLLLICSKVNASTQPLNIDNILNKTSIQNKHILVFFHMKYCSYCNIMKENIYKKIKIQDILKKDFIIIDINIDNNKEVVFNEILYSKRDFAYNLNIDFFPTVLFLDKNKDIVYTSRGYREIKKFTKILYFVKNKIYEDMDFFEYNNITN